MSIEANKQTIRRSYEELFNHGELALAEEFVSADFVNHELPPEAPRGPSGLRATVAMLRTAFPDIHFTVDELVGEGDTVVARTTMRGTHKGPFMGIAPTGRAVEQRQIHVMRFVDGKAVEHHALRDDLGLMQQLDVIPARPQEAA
jgi:steroid delta-isomerase-like uncharacterized protein